MLRDTGLAVAALPARFDQEMALFQQDSVAGAGCCNSRIA
jgi:hypothetical protein